jgi:hypothetical protein
MVLGSIVCLRPACELSAEAADRLVSAVDARVRTATPRPYAVVLDLSATPAVDDGARAALQSLHDLLAQSQVGLRLALSGARACGQFSGDGSGGAIRPDALHASVRAAMLAVYAALPGPALVTPAMRALLAQQPEPLLLPAGSVTGLEAAPCADSPRQGELRSLPAGERERVRMTSQRRRLGRLASQRPC